MFTPVFASGKLIFTIGPTGKNQMQNWQTSKIQKKKVTKWEGKSIHHYVLVWDKEIPPSDQHNFSRNSAEIILIRGWNFLVPHQ